jgi:hypothetical protein
MRNPYAMHSFVSPPAANFTHTNPRRPISINAIGLSVKHGDLTTDQAREIFTRAGASLKNAGAFPGDQRVLDAAERALAIADKIAFAASAEKPPSGPN